MPIAVAVSVAQAVCDQIAAAALSQKVTPERSYADWELKLADENRLHVDVVANATAQKTEPSARGVRRYTIAVDIAVRQRYGQDKQDDDTGRVLRAEVDALVLLTEQIHELFTEESGLTNFDSAVWQEERILVCPDKTMLREEKQFVGVVQVIFRVDTSL